jgi:Icc-related predicted phosphoesterase
VYLDRVRRGRAVYRGRGRSPAGRRGGAERGWPDRAAATILGWVRILLVSDLHYSLKQFDWVQSVAASFDVVVVAGDHLDIAAVADGDAQIIVILKYLQRLAAKTRVIVSSGNHDLTRLDESGEKTARWLSRARSLGVGTDGDVLEIDGTLFTICPYWDGPAGRARVEQLLARSAAMPRRRWIWVYHVPPHGLRVSWIGRRHFGDVTLPGWIEEYRPDLVLTGHVHQSPFRKGGSWVDKLGPTWVFNAGREVGPSPTHVIIDTDAMTAEWSSGAGQQQVGLDEAEAQPRPELFL